MQLLVSPEARLEFEAAERYYERQVPGLGTGSAKKSGLHYGVCVSGRSRSRWNAATSGV